MDISSQSSMEFSSETTEGKVFTLIKFCEIWILETHANIGNEKEDDGFPIALLGVLIGAPVAVLLIVVSIAYKNMSLDMFYPKVAIVIIVTRRNKNKRKGKNSLDLIHYNKNNDEEDDNSEEELESETVSSDEEN
jgi:hypothetical protein